MLNRISTLVVAAAALLATIPQALAHPHVWVTMKSEVVYNAQGEATGVKHAWTFDDMFSAFAIQGLETKKKGVYTREDLAPLAEVNVTSLKEYDYFTYAKVDGKKGELGEAADYWLDYKDETLTLHFTLPFKAPVKAKDLFVEIYDPTYFVDFSFAEKNAVALAGAPHDCKLTLGKPQELTAEMARKLAEIPVGEAIPANSYGAAFANKITVKCP